MLTFFKLPTYIGEKLSTTSSMKNLLLVTLQTLLEKELITVNDICTSEISKDLSGFVFCGKVVADCCFFPFFPASTLRRISSPHVSPQQSTAGHARPRAVYCSPRQSTTVHTRSR